MSYPQNKLNSYELFSEQNLFNELWLRNGKKVSCDNMSIYKIGEVVKINDN
ncbi:hypothetical protein JCM17380_01550 [Desulfosporosinus burensis]